MSEANQPLSDKGELNLKIAKIDGWEWREECARDFFTNELISGWLRGNEKEGCFKNDLPKYTKDLNEICRVIDELIEKEGDSFYFSYLTELEMICGFDYWRASAEKRCVALVNLMERRGAFFKESDSVKLIKPLKSDLYSLDIGTRGTIVHTYDGFDKYTNSKWGEVEFIIDGKSSVWSVSFDYIAPV